MQVTFWGVRGSHPVPGPQTVRYGGQTSCVEVCTGAGDRLILDAGTGLRELGRHLLRTQPGGQHQYQLLLSHVHWDHIQGLPFFEPAQVADNEIAIYALRTAADEIGQVISGISRHEIFLTPLELVPAQFSFHEVAPRQPLDIGPFHVTPMALNHPFGAVGYHIAADGTSVAYVSDTAPFTDVLHKQHFLSGPEELTDEDRATLQELERGLVAQLRDTDTVIFDTHFLPEEYARFPHYGHATPDHALALCTGIGVRRLVLFHHAPAHTDEIMDRIDETYRERGAAAGLEVVTARERMTLPIGGGGTEGVA
ncbi:MAG TPA: MBL fold metallo-hydrolase [Haliangium sp.]|nr:MBL fold metallo-hydrolase [Haliangium sp.]